MQNMQMAMTTDSKKIPPFNRLLKRISTMELGEVEEAIRVMRQVYSALYLRKAVIEKEQKEDVGDGGDVKKCGESD